MAILWRCAMALSRFKTVFISPLLFSSPPCPPLKLSTTTNGGLKCSIAASIHAKSASLSSAISLQRVTRKNKAACGNFPRACALSKQGDRTFGIEPQKFVGLQVAARTIRPAPAANDGAAKVLRHRAFSGVLFTDNQRYKAVGNVTGPQPRNFAKTAIKVAICGKFKLWRVGFGGVGFWCPIWLRFPSNRKAFQRCRPSLKKSAISPFSGQVGQGKYLHALGNFHS